MGFICRSPDRGNLQGNEPCGDERAKGPPPCEVPTKQEALSPLLGEFQRAVNSWSEATKAAVVNTDQPLGLRRLFFVLPPPKKIFFLPPPQICLLLKSPGALGTGLDQQKPLISWASSSMDYTREEGPALGRRPYKERKRKTFQKENKAKKTKRGQEARAGEDNLIPLSMVHTLWDPLEPGFSNLDVQRDPLGSPHQGARKK